jgi:ribosomal protein S18 acetylase RimI-like enzyme
MADPTKDGGEPAALREMAANRGCRLVRSRRRKPGGDFGRYGLTDAKSGKEIFGFGKSGLEASADEIADFLREGAASTWKSSLKAAGKAAKPAARVTRPAARRKRVPAKAPAPARRDAGAKPAQSARPDPPRLRIRVADAVDGEALAALLAELDVKANADEVSDRIGRLSRMGEPVLVAKLGDAVAGCVAWHVTPVLQRPHPVGRITLLVVAAASRRKGIGRGLAEAAEARLARRGCGLVEATGNTKLRAAHAFYRRLGYEKARHLFVRRLTPAKAD